MVTSSHQDSPRPAADPGPAASSGGSAGAHAPSSWQRPASEAKGHAERAAWGLRRLISGIVRLTDLQLRIWLTQAKIAALRVAVFSAVFILSLLLAVLAVIFLFIGAFRVLTDVAGLRPVWAFLIFGGGMLLLAAIIAGIGVKLLSGGTGPRAQSLAGDRTPAHAESHAAGKGKSA